MAANNINWWKWLSESPDINPIEMVLRERQKLHQLTTESNGKRSLRGGHLIFSIQLSGPLSIICGGAYSHYVKGVLCDILLCVHYIGVLC